MVKKIIGSLPSRTSAERQTMRMNAQLWASGNDAKKKEQGEALLKALEEFEGRVALAEAQRRQAMTEADRIEEAFTRVPPTESEVKMIQVLANPRVGNSTISLSGAMGWDKDNMFEGRSWNLHFGMMCKNRESYLSPAPPTAAGDGLRPARLSEKYYSKLIADLEIVDDHIAYEFRPAALEAFIRMGILSPTARDTPIRRQEIMEAEASERAARRREMFESMNQRGLGNKD